MTRTLGILVLILCFGEYANAAMITAQFSITYDAGYYAEGTITYDDSIAVVSASEYGPTNGIDFLDISFFDASNDELYSYVDVSGGESNYEFLEIEFDTTIPNFVNGSTFDLGQDTGAANEIYIRGEIGDASEYYVGVNDVITDVMNPSFFTITVVPEPSSLILAAIAFSSVSLLARRRSTGQRR